MTVRSPSTRLSVRSTAQFRLNVSHLCFFPRPSFPALNGAEALMEIAAFERFQSFRELLELKNFPQTVKQKRFFAIELNQVEDPQPLARKCRRHACSRSNARFDPTGAREETSGVQAVGSRRLFFAFKSRRATVGSIRVRHNALCSGAHDKASQSAKQVRDTRSGANYLKVDMGITPINFIERAKIFNASVLSLILWGFSASLC